MFEKLLALILHAKSGVVAAVLVAGTTTLVVSGTVTPESINLKLTPTTTNAPELVAKLASKTEDVDKDEHKNEQSCADAAHARNDALHTLQMDWQTQRKALAALKLTVKEKNLRPDQVEKVLEKYGKLIDGSRRDTQKAIQQLVGFKSDDEDKNDEHADNTNNDQHANTDVNKDEDKNDEDKSDDADKNESPGTSTPNAKPCPTVDATALAKLVSDANDKMKGFVTAAATDLSKLTPAAPRAKGEESNQKHDGEHDDSD